MAKGRGHVRFVEYESESTEEEEEEEDEGSEEAALSDSDSDSGPEQSPIAKKPSSLSTSAIGKSQPQAAPRIHEEQMKEQLETETETDSTSGSESDSEPAPNASDSVYVRKTSKAGGGTKASVTASGVKRPAQAKDFVRASCVKRPVEEKDTEAKDVKKSKKKPPEYELETSAAKRFNDDSKKQLFQRLWSENDEIVILKGMIDYMEKNKSDPGTNLNAFHNFIRDNLHVNVIRSQLQDKIRRLKKKYKNNKDKEKEGKDRIVIKPHEHKVYELSKQIWGCENGKESRPKTNESQRAIAIENGEFEDGNIARIINGGWVRSLSAMKSNDMCMDERVYRIGADLFEGKDGVEGAKEWRMLNVQEIEVHLKMLEIKRARVKLVLDSLSSSNE